MLHRDPVRVFKKCDKVAYWPSGLALFFPLPKTVNGTVTFNIGDVNLTMKKYFESQVTFQLKTIK